MIYCQGRKSTYDDYIATDPNPGKLGRLGPEDPDDPNYPGGSVWKSEAEARACCPEGYDVYGVIADWDTQTVKSADGDYHDLLVTSKLVKL